MLSSLTHSLTGDRSLLKNLATFTLRFFLSFHTFASLSLSGCVCDWRYRLRCSPSFIFEIDSLFTVSLSVGVTSKILVNEKRVQRCSSNRSVYDKSSIVDGSQMRVTSIYHVVCSREIFWWPWWWPESIERGIYVRTTCSAREAVQHNRQTWLTLKCSSILSIYRKSLYGKVLCWSACQVFHERRVWCWIKLSWLVNESDHGVRGCHDKEGIPAI